MHGFPWRGKLFIMLHYDLTSTSTYGSQISSYSVSSRSITVASASIDALNVDVVFVNRLRTSTKDALYARIVCNKPQFAQTE